MKTCIICLRPASSNCGIEACPSLCEHKHIGVDIESNDAIVKGITSPIAERGALANLVLVGTSTVQLRKEGALWKLRRSFQPIN